MLDDLNDMNRVREDEWPIQLPALPYPPTPTSQDIDNSFHGRLKQQKPNSPACPHPKLGNGSQLPPIRNLVPNLWEPGASKSSHQISTEEGQNGTSVYRLRPVGPAWGGGPPNASDSHAPHPQLEANNHGNECNRGTPRRVKESNKRPPPPPIERAELMRTAPSNGTTDSNRGIVGRAHTPPQTFNRTRGKSVVRSRSNSEATRSTNEPPENDSQSSHQELLRDPHYALRQLLAPRPVTIHELHRGRNNGASKRVLRSGS